MTQSFTSVGSLNMSRTKGSKILENLRKPNDFPLRNLAVLFTETPISEPSPVESMPSVKLIFQSCTEDVLGRLVDYIPVTTKRFRSKAQIRIPHLRQYR